MPEEYARHDMIRWWIIAFLAGLGGLRAAPASDSAPELWNLAK